MGSQFTTRKAVRSLVSELLFLLEWMHIPWTIQEQTLVPSIPFPKAMQQLVKPLGRPEEMLEVR